MKDVLMAPLLRLVERGPVPDALVRAGIRRLLGERLKSLPREAEALTRYKNDFVAAMVGAPVATLTEAANEQHYEVPVAYYDEVLGPRKKYSCCYWDGNTRTLAQAEENALAITCERAQLENGQRILELGCGWGSLTLWMAEQYPASEITAVSNSSSQGDYIRAAAATRGLGNVRVITADMVTFDTGGVFDRVVSVEMFEHMRNWWQLFARINRWLTDDGLFFMHVFCHRTSPYLFEVKDSGDWMSRYFFSGGMMPSSDLPLYFQDHLRLNKHWAWNGQHYATTLLTWLANQDRRRDRVMQSMADLYGEKDAATWFRRWRLFYLACAELFLTRGGNEWYVGHYRFSRRGEVARG